MSLDKAIESGKERRAKRYGAKAVSKSCRNHGNCPYCEGNRQNKNKNRIKSIDNEILEYYNRGTNELSESE